MALGGEGYFLNSPQGSVYNLATWINLSQGEPDFGDGFMAANYTSNPAAEGGQLAYESIGVRTMRFPLLVASSSNADMLETEQLLRMAARPGAFLDIKLDGVATVDAIRFDVLTGRYKPDYSYRQQAIFVRQGILEVDVQPLGYMPTEILLASVASVGLPGKMTIPGGSILGDVPGLGNLLVQLTNAPPTNYPAGTWGTDFMAWSLGARASFSAYLPAASFTSLGEFSAASLAGDKFAPASQGYQIVPSQNLANWKVVAYLQFGSLGQLSPAYRGRFRVFTWAKLGPSQPLPWYVSADVTEYDNRALASVAPIATLAPAVASGNPGAYGAQPSPAYSLLDLGELAIPAHGSGASVNPKLRLWISPATSNAGVATTTITFGGVYLLPLSEAAGVVPRGIVVPTTNTGTTMEAPFIRVNAIRQEITLDGPPQSADLLAQYRGLFPYVGPSSAQVDLLIGERPLGVAATGPVARSFNERNDGVTVSLTYRPRFAFVRGI
jgi:hypothetical protein